MITLNVRGTFDECLAQALAQVPDDYVVHGLTGWFCASTGAPMGLRVTMGPAV